MESPNNLRSPDSASPDQLSLSDVPSETADEDPALERINQLEQQLYACFSDLQQKLEQCEKSVQAAVSKAFNDVKTANVESFDAVQLDLELLRQKVRNSETESAPQEFIRGIQTLEAQSLVPFVLSVDPRKVGNYVTNNVKIRFKLPSSELTPISESSPQGDNSILFDRVDTIGGRVESGTTLFPFDELMREKESRRRSVLVSTTPIKHDVKAVRTPPPERAPKSPTSVQIPSPRPLPHTTRYPLVLATILIAVLSALVSYLLMR